MCGVFGFACNKPTRTMFDLASAIMCETESRGPHATGHAYLQGRKIRHGKAAIKASEYVTDGRWTSLRKHMPKRLLGHCRFTTHGSETENINNHPHVGNRYALIHNGVLKGYEYAPWKELCRSQCDSEAILRVMELGSSVRDAVARVFNCFYESNFSVLTLDQKTGEMHFFRNPGRPLQVWRGTDFVLIGSTENILENAFQTTFQIPSAQVKGLQKWSPIAGTLYTVEKDLTINKTALFDYTPEVQTGATLPAKVQQYAHYTGSYNLGSKGYGKPNRAARVDRQGNLIYDFDERS